MMDWLSAPILVDCLPAEAGWGLWKLELVFRHRCSGVHFMPISFLLTILSKIFCVYGTPWIYQGRWSMLSRF